MRPDPQDAKFVRAVGGDLSCEIERNPNPFTVDHVWITMNTGREGPLVISVNTRSLFNERAGFDGRVRRGTLRGSWDKLPEKGIWPCPRFDYTDIEREANIYYEPCAREELESYLIETSKRAILLEVWGTTHSRPTSGLHQIHSRRASCAVSRDLAGQDGALQFYFTRNQSTLLVLFKFCGQP